MGGANINENKHELRLGMFFSFVFCLPPEVLDAWVRL